MRDRQVCFVESSAGLRPVLRISRSPISGWLLQAQGAKASENWPLIPNVQCFYTKGAKHAEQFLTAGSYFAVLANLV